ncbi:hypothetical protein KGY47_03220 [Candidatus Bipolaricaulota bacterium]|nr:hypothetical protein [Candidatus Bipolaricaulota bacterium]MBS3824962.1 hypothetical protein [Candidatus Bipolaricaulota bacterium]
MRSKLEGIAVLDENKEFKYLDKSFAELYGYQHPSQLIGHSWGKTYLSSHLQRLEEEILPFLGDKKRWSGVIFGLRQNGDRCPQQISVLELDSESLVLLVQNLTPKGRTAFEIGHPEINWPEAVDSPPDIVAIISPEYEIKEINFTGAKKLGKDPNQLRGAKCYELVHDLPYPIQGCPCKKTLDTGNAGVGVVSEDEQEYVVTAFPLLDKSMELGAFLHTVTEVSNQPPAELRACQFFARNLNQMKGKHQLYSFLVDSIKELCGLGKITLYEQEENKLKCVFQDGYRRPMEGGDIYLDGDGVRIDSYRENKSIYLPDVAGRNDFIRYDPEIECEFVTPISTSRNRNGILDIRLFQRDSVSASERNLIEIMVSEVARQIEDSSTPHP